MSLPKVAPPTEKYDLEGENITIRALTRGEAYTCQKIVAEAQEAGTVVPWDEIEIAVIAGGTDTPPDEVRTWYAAVSSHVVDPLVDAIRKLSRLDEGAQKSS